MVKSKISKTKISKTKNSRTSRKIRKGGGNPTPEECCEIDSQNLGKKHKNTFTRCFNATFKLNNSENEYLSPEDKIRVESSNKKNLIRKKKGKKRQKRPMAVMKSIWENSKPRICLNKPEPTEIKNQKLETNPVDPELLSVNNNINKMETNQQANLPQKNQTNLPQTLPQVSSQQKNQSLQTNQTQKNQNLQTNQTQKNQSLQTNQTQKNQNLPQVSLQKNQNLPQVSSQQKELTNITSSKQPKDIDEPLDQKRQDKINAKLPDTGDFNVSDAGIQEYINDTIEEMYNQQILQFENSYSKITMDLEKSIQSVESLDTQLNDVFAKYQNVDETKKQLDEQLTAMTQNKNELEAALNQKTSEFKALADAKKLVEEEDQKAKELFEQNILELKTEIDDLKKEVRVSKGEIKKYATYIAKTNQAVIKKRENQNKEMNILKEKIVAHQNKIDAIARKAQNPLTKIGRTIPTTPTNATATNQQTSLLQKNQKNQKNQTTLQQPQPQPQYDTLADSMKGNPNDTTELHDGGRRTKKVNLRWRYVSDRVLLGGYKRDSLNRIAKKWGIANPKKYSKKGNLQKVMHLSMYAKFGDMKSRKALNYVAMSLGLNPKKYRNKVQLYKAISQKTNKLSFNLRGGKKTKKTRRN